MQFPIPIPLFRKFLLWRSRRLSTPRLLDDFRGASLLTLSDDESLLVSRILDLRHSLNKDDTPIQVQDYGAGSRVRNPRGNVGERTVGSIYSSAAIPHAWGLLLFSLVRSLQPHRILELGTNLGVSACYMKAAQMLNNQEGTIVTIEGDPTLARTAESHLRELAGDQFNVVTGPFADTLPSVLERFAPFDLVFIDGHHQKDAALRYFEMIAPGLADPACVIFDDIEPWVRTIRPAWNQLVGQQEQAEALDLIKLGLLFFGYR